MKYPTEEEVHAADQRQLGSWMRFLPNPGSSAIGTSTAHRFPEILVSERRIFDLISSRFKGWNPKLSKEVGWEL